MWSLTKIQEEISNRMNLKLRKLASNFNNSLIDLEIIIEEREKINNNERLEIEKTEGMTRKVLEELEWELKFLTIKNRSFRNLSDYEEEKEIK